MCVCVENVSVVRVVFVFCFLFFNIIYTLKLHIGEISIKKHQNLVL